LPSDKDVANQENGGNDLYMYDEVGTPTGHLVQLSKGNCGEKKKNGKEEEEETTCGKGAEVQGVVRTSSDGSHVYFVARGLLTAQANAAGQSAERGADNLYAVNANTGETKFVAELCSGHGEKSGTVPDKLCPFFPEVPLEGQPRGEEERLWGGAFQFCSTAVLGAGACDNSSRQAQTTPDGRFLVFSTHAQLETGDTNEARAVYLYDFQTGKLTWISHGAPGFSGNNEGKNAEIAPVNGYPDGANADINDWGRAITSDEEGEHDGEYVMFTTEERLSPQDNNHFNESYAEGDETGNDVYLWHNGTVSLISPGERGGAADQAEGAASFSGMSASGSDIFFTTGTPLVGQDKDELIDVYDARVNGGFPAPPTPPPCFPASCQPESTLPTFGSPASMVFAGGNVSTVTNLTREPPSVTISAATLSGNTVMVTVKTSQNGTVTITGAGLRSATKTVVAGVNRLSLPLTSAGKRTKRRHGTTKLKATLKVGTSAASTTRTVRL
jgi:hypothetical protein